MTDRSAERIATDAPVGEAQLAWEVPEAAAVAVLVAVALLIAGGLVAGIVASTASYGPVSPSHLVVGTAISWGSQWAQPLIGLVLLAVIGLCWWQSEAWSDASEPDDDQDRALQVAGHMRRASQISRWTLAAFLLTLAGALSDLVGSILQNSGVENGLGPLGWTRYIIQGASLLAVVVIAITGFWIARQINNGEGISE